MQSHLKIIKEYRIARWPGGSASDDDSRYPAFAVTLGAVMDP